MIEVLVLGEGPGGGESTVEFLGRRAVVRHVSDGGSRERLGALIEEHDGSVAAMALDHVPIRLCLGSKEVAHEAGSALAAGARRTPVLDGSEVRPMLERWAVAHAERCQPGIFRDKRVLLVPGLNHPGLADALAGWTSHLRYADPVAFFGVPRLPGVGSPWSLGTVAKPTLNLLRRTPLPREAPNSGLRRRAQAIFRWAEVLAGDVGLIRALAPPDLEGKTVVVERAAAADVADLAARGVRIVVTLMPALREGEPAGESAATLEALLAGFCRELGRPLNEDTCLDLLSDLEWNPDIRYLKPAEAEAKRFAFVIHPLGVDFIHRHPAYRWTRFLPDALVETFAAHMKPMLLSTIRGCRSPQTGQKVEGFLISLGATPRQMMRRDPRFTYRRLEQAAFRAEKLGARILGLGAFTSVIGDAGITVARESPIAVTSGNSLTVAATLEVAKQAAIRMGARDLTRGRAMVVGATGSIGSVCARMIAQAVHDVVLVSIEPEKLVQLKRLILRETPHAKVRVATRASGLVGDCDVIVTATSGFGQRILDISECKPGAIICDVARPPDISDAEAALRPDVLVIESGEVLIPGDVDFGYDIGLPPKVAYACLAETALLAMEGRFESFTLGRELAVDRVKEIYRLFHKHGFKLAGLRSLGRYLTDEEVEEKRRLADALRGDVLLFREARETASRELAKLPGMSKGVRAAG